MSDQHGPEQHPTDEELAAWIANQAPSPEAAALLTHVWSCALCRERWTARAESVILGPAGPESPLGFDSYDFALLRAFARVEPPQPRTYSLSDRSTLWALASALLDCASEERNNGQLADAHDDAYWAVVCALRIPAVGGPPDALADLRCRAWLELGNLRRAHNDLDGAEAALVEAQTCFEAGSQYPPLLARWLDVAGSLFRDQLRFNEAVEALEDATRIHLEYDCRELAARALINLGITYSKWGKVDIALEAYSQAFDHLLACPPDDLMLTLTAMHNALFDLVDAGAADAVGRLLWLLRPHYYEIATPHLLIRLDYLDARVAARQGHHVRAVRLFRKTVAAFEKASLPYDAALTALELAALLVERRRPAAEVLAVLDGPVRAFVERQIYRELLISFKLVRTAVKRGSEAVQAIAWFAEEVRAVASRPAVRK
jgi:tetratricopeptide (TPR) repeat protein